MSNSDLNVAKSADKDEFYTSLKDIELEMPNYKDHFQDKVIYCNCDNPEHSAFWEYFHAHFAELKLKELISTHYVKLPDNPLFCIDPNMFTYKMTYSGGNDDDITAGDKVRLSGNGDFRSAECIDILKSADIVVTNPPFSMFQEYIFTLMKYDKSFIVLGNMNAVTYKEVFPLIKDNKMWYGASIHSGDRKFYIPDDYPLDASICGIDDDGRRYVNVKGVRWFTNLDYVNHHTDLELSCTYSLEDYPKLDNYAAINVGETEKIPNDYSGVMAVPITFLDKYNPDQFEIIGMTASWCETEEVRELKLSPNHRHEPILNGEGIYKRLLIRRR